MVYQKMTGDQKQYPVDTIVDGEIVNKNEYSLFVKIENLDITLSCTVMI